MTTATYAPSVTANFKAPITLYYREVDGSLRLLLTDEGEINRFVDENLLFLDDERGED